MATSGRHDHRFWRMLLESWRHQQDFRTRAEKAYRYYDGEQWTSSEKEVLNERGQQATVINLCRPTVDTLHAVYADRKTDIQAVGREMTDDELAGVVTQMLKQGFDETVFSHTESQVFRSGALSGIGWVALSTKDGIPCNGTDSDLEIDITLVNWEDMYFDPFYKKIDGSDMRYVIRRVWMDIDQVQEEWPDAADQISAWVVNLGIDEPDMSEQNAQSNTGSGAGNTGPALSDFDRRTNRVAVHECYYYDRKMKLRHCIFVDSVFLQGSEDDADNDPPHEMNFIPYIPFIANRDRHNLPQGILDWILGIQDSVNKLYSKWQWNMMTRQLIYEDGAIDDVNEVRSQLAKPDGVIRVEQGALTGGRVQIPKNIEESQHLSNMMAMLTQMSQRVTGLNDAMMGIGGNNARTAQQEAGRQIQGAQMQTSIIENMFAFKRRLAWAYLMFMGKYYDKPRVVRVVGPNGLADYYKINEEYLAADGTTRKLSMRDALRFDVVLRLVPAFSTVRQNTLTILAEMAKAGAVPPPIAAKMAIELAELPDKQRLIQESEAWFQQQAQLASQQAQAGVA